MMDYPYTVQNLCGDMILQSLEKDRYHPHIELSILEAGYIIRLHGKRITKTDLRKETSHVKNR